jgi:precorrin-3B synthase
MSVVRGWCPTAWTPMAAGDGLLLRVRPRLGRMTRGQAAALAEVAAAHGNGAIDLTSRAALQIRGLGEAGWRAALERLVEAGLVDPDPHADARAPTIVAPGWAEGDDTHRLATELRDRAGELPPLSGKIGFAIDAGETAVLGADPADFRIERGADGGLILRADGHAAGVWLAPGGEIDALFALAWWFVESGGVEAGRMVRHRAPLPAWASGEQLPRRAETTLAPGPHPLGTAIGFAFGRIEADALAGLLDGGARALRLTPWRIAIVEGGASFAPSVDPALLAVDACVGAPACPQATVATRPLAARLAHHVRGLHVSGCAKGCARARPAAITLTGRDGRFDLGVEARAGDAPAVAGLDAAHVLARLGAA